MRGDDQCCVSFSAKSKEQLDDFFAGVGIEVAGWFIGKDQLGRIDERTRQSDALLFTAGKFSRLVFEPVA